MELYFACVQTEFEMLSFKECQILGGSFGVCNYSEQTTADLAEKFQMTENALLKAKDKALKKLTVACMAGELAVWKEIHKLLQQAQRECVATEYYTPQSAWYKKEKQQR